LRIFRDPWGKSKIPEDLFEILGENRRSLRIFQDPWGRSKILEALSRSLGKIEDRQGSFKIPGDFPKSSGKFEYP
jgi:hypothetical protein